jgi:hypothetical protein
MPHKRRRPPAGNGRRFAELVNRQDDLSEHSPARPELQAGAERLRLVWLARRYRIQATVARAIAGAAFPEPRA